MHRVQVFIPKDTFSPSRAGRWTTGLLIKVFVAGDDFATDVTRHCMAVRAHHLVTLDKFKNVSIGDVIRIEMRGEISDVEMVYVHRIL